MKENRHRHGDHHRPEHRNRRHDRHFDRRGAAEPSSTKARRLVEWGRSRRSPRPPQSSETSSAGSLLTRRWSKPDSNLYGAFPCQGAFSRGWHLIANCCLTVLCSERERPFFVPSPAIRFPERAEGVKGPKR